MSASAATSRAARFRMIAALAGWSDIDGKPSSALRAGPTMSSVVVGRYAPLMLKRSPQKSVRVVWSYNTPASQACGTWGVSIHSSVGTCRRRPR
jgi:hypothetical protein